MKVVMSIFLSLQIITNCTFFEDVVRIPSLLEHFEHHSEKENGHLSFLDFIVMHYFTSSLDNDTAHNTLPLHHSGDIGHVHSNPPCTLPEALQCFIPQALEVRHVFYAEAFHLNNLLNSIFQPPRS